MKNSELLLELESLHPPSSDLPFNWKFEGAQSGPKVTLLGGMHGNETIGAQVFRNILPLVQHYIRAGALNIAIGNVEACKIDKRCIGKIDANRLFGEPTVENAHLPEKIRIENLKPIIAGSDVMIDLHSTIKKSEPFLIVPKIDHRFASCIPYLGIGTIITGPGLQHPSGESIESDLYAAAHQALGMTLEAGPEDDMDPEAITNSVLATLVYLDILDESILNTRKPKSPPEIFKTWNAYQQVFAEYKGNNKGKKFRFTKAWKNFEFIRGGTTIAIEDGEPIIVEKDSRILFAKPPDQIVPGNQVCLLLDADPGIMAVDSYNRKAA